MRIDVLSETDLVAAVRGTDGESIVLVIQPGREPLAQAQTLAAIAPLAIERAPATRVNAVVVLPSAAAADVDAAAAFLDSARSTTGQVIEVN